MSDVISKSRFAEILGVSKPRISQYCRDGMPVRSDGKVDFEEASEWLRQNVKRLKSADRTELNSPDGESLISSRIKLLEVQIARGEVALSRERGDVICRDTARKFVRDWGTHIKTGLLNFASRRGPEIAAELGADEVALVAALEAAMREHMIEMAEEKLPLNVEAAR